jgi:hypothetical protein
MTRRMVWRVWRRCGEGGKRRALVQGVAGVAHPLGCHTSPPHLQGSNGSPESGVVWRSERDMVETWEEVGL